MKQSTLGSYIRFLRAQNKMTQAQLADKLGITDKAVSKWERDVSYPDVALFPRLADVLGVTVNDLLKECLDSARPSRLLQIFGMSHDIRTPLHIILGCVSMAELHRDDPEQLSRYLESIRVSGEYLLRSIEQVMEVASRDTDSPQKKSYPANVRELGEYLEKSARVRINELQKYDFSGKRVLVVDDIMLNREISGEILKQVGATAEFAENGKVCVKMVKAAPAGYYDLILMDIMMPDMDGLEATRQIRELPDPQKAAIPIIALSANVYEKERKEAEDAGMNDFVNKPIFVKEMFETLNKYM